MRKKGFDKICRGCGRKIHIYSTNCPYCGQIQSTFRSQTNFNAMQINNNKKQKK